MEKDKENKVVFTVPEDCSGLRIDKLLSEKFPDYSRNFFQRLLSGGQVTANGYICRKQDRVAENQDIQIIFPELSPCVSLPEEIPLDIIYEDEQLLIVNKQKGMVVHPAPSHQTGTLVNALLHHCDGKLSGINGVIRPGIVHRIDKDTSGLLVIAKTDFAHQALAEQIQNHSFERSYEAVIYGRLAEKEGVVDLPIGRSRFDRKKMCVTYKNSKRAVTNYTVKKEFAHFSQLQLNLHTGRTHQIRVHMAHIGHPIAGDPVYGPRKCITELNGQCLHAKTIGFLHPTSKKWLRFESELPGYFDMFIQKLQDGKVIR